MHMQYKLVRTHVGSNNVAVAMIHHKYLTNTDAAVQTARRVKKSECFV